MKLLQVLGCHVILLYMVNSLEHSLFSKTSIIINTCPFDNFLKEIQVNHRFQCSMTCSLDSDCRRYLYCESELSCKTYLDGTDCILSDKAAQCSCYIKNIGLYKGVYTCRLGCYGNECQYIIKDCAEGFSMAITMGYKIPALANIQPGYIPFEIRCDFGNHGYMALLNRESSCLVEDFNRTMDEYKNGFGLVSGNRWVGLERMYEIFSLPNTRFTVRLRGLRSDSSQCESYFYNVRISDVNDEYRISYSVVIHNTAVGGCGNPFGPTGKNSFSTFDQNNTGSNQCAARFGGGWWFDTTVDCTKGFLTGTMDGSGVDNFLSNSPSPESFTSINLEARRYPLN